jgi:hypothetical protein
MCYQQRWHPRFVHADAHAEAGHAWLRDFKYGTADVVSIADADLVVRKPLQCEIFAELTERKIAPAQKVLPVVIRVHLVDKYGSLLPAMTREIGLRIAIDIEFAHHSPSRNRGFPDGSSDRFAVPRHVARKTDIHGKQFGHCHLVKIQRQAGIQRYH